MRMTVCFLRGWLALALLVPGGLAYGQANETPRIIAYSAQPNEYFNAEASEVAKLYDGFYFVVGDWDTGVATHLGLPSQPPASDWRDRVAANIQHLRAAGATENLLGVHFDGNGAWPSPDTLLDPAFLHKMAVHFGALGSAAKELGFRGVSIDLEYPYPRYGVDHEIYTYDGYSVEDLLAAAVAQGRAAASALLDAYTEAVVFALPGELHARPIARAFQTAFLDVMAERDAPGGFHLGYERSYCLYEPASQVAIPREADCIAPQLLKPATLAYWIERCTVAPGVWPLHMVETGGKDYPVRPWKEELAELAQQMSTLRTVAKRYIWSYSGQPVWYRHTPDLETKYGLKKQAFEGVDEAIPGWHAILTSKAPVTEPRLKSLVAAVSRFDAGKLTPQALCDRFGTPGEWWLLGPLGNPRIAPQFAAPAAALAEVRSEDLFHGRDGAVAWRRIAPLTPLGTVSLKQPFDWRATDDMSVHLVATVRASGNTEGYLWVNWDDGIIVRLDDAVVFDRSDYPEKGHGLLYRDRFLFEEKVPVTLAKGETRLAVTCINAKGSVGFNLRFADAEGYPLPDLSFSLP